MILPSEVIRVRRRRGVIKPVYASEAEASLAKTIVSVFEEHVGGTRGGLKEALSGCEMLGFDFKLVRGLSAVLEDHCVFGSRGVMDPLRVRRAVFEEAGRRVVASEDDRRAVLGAASFRLGASVYDLERSLYSDLQDEQELQGFEPIEPMALLGGYNFSLLASLLAHARRLEVEHEGELPEIHDLCSRIGECQFTDVRGSNRLTLKLPARLSGYRALHLHDLLTKFMEMKRWSVKAEVVYPPRSKKPHTFEERSRSDLVIKPLQPREEPPVVPPVRRARVRVRSEVIDVERTADRLGVTEDEVRDLVEGMGYVDLGGILVAKAKLQEVEEALSGISDMRFGEVRRVLRAAGVKEPVPLLEALGYVVEWNRDRDESLVYRI